MKCNVSINEISISTRLTQFKYLFTYTDSLDERSITKFRRLYNVCIIWEGDYVQLNFNSQYEIEDIRCEAYWLLYIH